MQCLHRIYLPGRGAVPCGRCVNCRKNRRQSWVYRLQAEADLYPFSLFVTLTYDDAHLPAVMAGDNLFKTRISVVSKKDVQLFMKRLRKKYNDLRLRYFVTSEYGSQFGRPHYHMILFGFPFRGREGSDLLAECWQNGFVQAYPLTTKEISYVTKYMYEKSMIPDVLKDLKEYHPFMLCSRVPGIGFGFLRDQILDFYRLHPRDYVRAYNGFKMAMPRYYADKLYDDDMREYLKELREAFFLNGMEEQWQHYRNTDPRLRILSDMNKTDSLLSYEERAKNKLKLK